MFEPSRDQVREMFFETWRKYRAGLPLAGVESLALDTVLLHRSITTCCPVWRAQRERAQPDVPAYLECLRKRAARR